MKLYALQGTPFCDALLGERDQTGAVPTWDLIGIFAIDPFSILKVIAQPSFADRTWASVEYPVSLVVYGERQ